MEVRVAGKVEPDRIVLARDLAVPVARFHHLELAVDINVLELIDQDNRGIAIDRDVSRRDLEREPFVGAVAELLHELAGLRAVRLEVWPVTRDGLEHVRRHPPHSLGRRQHGGADIVLAFGENVDEGLAVERKRHGLAQIGVVERRLVAVDDEIRAHIDWDERTYRLRRL